MRWTRRRAYPSSPLPAQKCSRTRGQRGRVRRVMSKGRALGSMTGLWPFGQDVPEMPNVASTFLPTPRRTARATKRRSESQWWCHMTSGETGWTRGIRMSRRCAALLSLSVLACTMGCAVTPSDSGASDRNATSCIVFDALNGQVSPDPNFRQIVALASTLFVLVGQSTEARACFFRDIVRPAEQAAITWTVADASIATVAPAAGPVVRIFGQRSGRTTLTALITGVPVSVVLFVCPPGETLTACSSR